MSEVKFTPGPWFVHNGVIPHNGGWTGTYDILNKEGYENGVKMIGDVKPYGGRFPDREEANANAKLIAAAPDMLDALIEVKKHLLAEGYGALDTVYARIINAIEKATL